ncbi:hypothetical protein L6164_018418 [Bauhinia variegata]|uniref:Uncharacterized protein n=1 Tax=Bauhinia variegata TaxID=167791 RepID=A0ACB9NB82_BAUVA|nr:hypothetical protein L6164_018418 [Bauhinia variegata]
MCYIKRAVLQSKCFSLSSSEQVLRLLKAASFLQHTEAATMILNNVYQCHYPLLSSDHELLLLSEPRSSYAKPKLALTSSFAKGTAVSATGIRHAFPVCSRSGYRRTFSQLTPPRARTQFPEVEDAITQDAAEETLAAPSPKRGNGAPSHPVQSTSNITIKGILATMMESVNEKDKGRVVALAMGDPTAHSCFTTAHVADDAVLDSVQSHKFNGYAPTVGLPDTRRAIAKYLSRDLPYDLSPDDVYVTSGCTQAIDVALSTIARPGSNVLIPRPGFPIYNLCASFRNIEVRHYDLIPKKGWEVNLNAVKALADRNTAAIVIINPGNPCANVYPYEHLQEIVETAERLNIPIIADEVYAHLAFGKNKFVPLGTFGSSVPVITLGSLSKRWLVPGWRLGWFATTDPNGLFKSPKFVERVKKYFDILGGPATFIQAAVPRILEQTDEAFFDHTIDLLKKSADICFERIKEIPGLTCHQKPEGSMAVMVKLNMSNFNEISDDIDFCFKLVKEEAVVLLPGITVGYKNWIRITFAVDPSSLEEGLQRLKSFCQRHTTLQNYVLPKIPAHKRSSNLI